VAPRKTRTIDIEAFVYLGDIDPIYFDHPYFLAPWTLLDDQGRSGRSARRVSPSAVSALTAVERGGLPAGINDL
jgi:hypothetical protein